MGTREDEGPEQRELRLLVDDAKYQYINDVDFAYPLFAPESRTAVSRTLVVLALLDERVPVLFSTDLDRWWRVKSARERLHYYLCGIRYNDVPLTSVQHAHAPVLASTKDGGVCSRTE